jgi:hypothetical protein
MKKWVRYIAINVFAWPLAFCIQIAHAQSNDFVPLAPIPGLNQGISATEQGVATFLNNLYTFMIGIAVILAVGMIIYGGVRYALSEVPSAKGDGKRHITQALFGLVIVLAPALVFGIINPAILNLNVSMPALKTTWGTSTAPSPTAPDPIIRPTDHINAGKTWCYRPEGQAFSCYATETECVTAMYADSRMMRDSSKDLKCMKHF